ncbi:hypothetical protein BH11ARM2_BH11ARM2_21440 [soil metagenome]
MLNAKSGLVALALLGGLAQQGRAQARPTLGDLLQQVRLFEENLRDVRFSFEGDRTSTAPVQTPSLKSEKPVFKPGVHINRFKGTFLKFDRDYFIRYQINADPAFHVVQSDGIHIAQYDEGGKRNSISGLDGTMNEAGEKGPLNFFENFGTFYPFRNDWVQEKTLSSLIEPGKIVRVETSPDGLQTFHLAGLTAPFALTLNPRHLGEIRKFGFLLEKNRAKADLFWRADDYISMDGKRVPRKLEHLNHYSEGGKVVTEDHTEWKLKDLSFAVTQSEVLKPLPQGKVFQTLDDSKVGRVANDNGTMREVEANYGTEAYVKRQLTRKGMMGAGALGFLLLGAYGVRQIRRRTS